MTSTFSTNKAPLASEPSLSTFPVPPPLPVKHWSQTCHDTILSSNDPQRSLQLSLAGGAENGRFIYLNESVSILRSKPLLTIVKGSKIDADELVLEIDRQSIAGCTLADVELLVERFSSAGKQIQLKTIKSGMFVCLLKWTSDSAGGNERSFHSIWTQPNCISRRKGEIVRAHARLRRMRKEINKDSQAARRADAQGTDLVCFLVEEKTAITLAVTDRSVFVLMTDSRISLLDR